MVREQNKILKKLVVFTDLCIVALSLILAYYLRYNIQDIYTFTFILPRLHPIHYYLGQLPMLILTWGGFLFYFGMYKSSCIRKTQEAFFIVLKTAFFGFIVFSSYVFILNMQEDVSRLVIVFTFIIASIMVILEKAALAYLFRKFSMNAITFKGDLFNFKNILIVGTWKRAEQLIKLITKNPEWGLKIVGIVDKEYSKKGEIINGHKVIGVFDDIPGIIHENAVNEIVFAVPHSWLNEIEDIMYFCESEGITVNLAVDLFEFKFSKAKQTDLQGFPLLTFESTSDKLEHLFIKRAFDFIFSGIALILLSPAIIILSIIFKLISKGPIFFKQARCSLHGRKFILYKFRTMVVDAESKLRDILVHNEMSGPAFKITDDPRMTKVGKWLRRYSLDELPQLWNVFKGDMSLVGPRPPLLSEVEEYNPWQRRKLSMRPGITCLWQISGRNIITDFNEWMKLDLEYIDNWSLKLDFKIFFKTILVVLSAKGAK